MRVLLIDDTIQERDLLRNHLECLGAAVVAEAANTLQGLDLFRTVSPDLTILDIAVAQTGGIGGTALFRIMRSEAPEMPVLLVSAMALPEVRRSFQQQGALEYLFKPFSNRTFEQVRDLLIERFPQLGSAATIQRPAASLRPQLPVTLN